MNATLVFPFWGGTTKEQTGQVLIAYQKQKEAAAQCGIRFVVVDDGGLDREMGKIFTSDREVRDIAAYMVLEPQRGLTRSWNEGAKEAFESGSDVVVLSNFDCWPNSPTDLENLVKFCDGASGKYFACGPLTNAPGHIPQQYGVEALKDGSRPVVILNGFTWAVNRYSWQSTVDKRGMFLLDLTTSRFLLGTYGGHIEKHEGPASQSLAMVGQEDEIFWWSAKQLNMPNAIVHSSYWHHDKLASHRGG